MQALLFFVFDTGKQFLAEPGDCLRLVKRQMIVDFATGKMAGLTSRLKDRLDLCVEVGFLCGGSNRRGGKPFRDGARTSQARAMTRYEAGSQKQRQHEHACSDAGNATPQLGQLRLGRRPT